MFKYNIRRIALLFLAAHAPHDIPSWFTPDMDGEEPPKEPEIPFDYSTLNNRARNLCSSWRSDEFDLDGTIAAEVEKKWITTKDAERIYAYTAQVDDWRERSTDYDRRRTEARIAQWPWKWSSLVLDARGRR